MTTSAVATRSGRKPGQPVGDRPRWEILFDALNALAPGALLRYEEMGTILGLDFFNPKQKHLINSAAKKAAQELQERQNKVCQVERGHGYSIAAPSQVLALARRDQTKAVEAVAAGAAKVDTINLDSLDPTMRRVVEATALGFNRQRIMMHQMDVRQEKLEATLRAMGAQVEATTQRVDEQAAQQATMQQEMATLQQRMSDLAQRMQGAQSPPTQPAPHTPPPPPVSPFITPRYGAGPATP